MKERIELTTKQLNPTLEIKGNIFMPEPGAGEIQSHLPKEQTAKGNVPHEKIEASKSAWDKLNEGRTVPIDERRTQQMLIERGIMPILGAEEPEASGGGGGNGGEKPPAPPEGTPQEEPEKPGEPEPGREEPKEEHPRKTDEELSAEARERMEEAEKLLGPLRRDLEAALKEQGIEDEKIKEITREFMASIDVMGAEANIAASYRRAMQEGREIYVPRSLEDLAKLIMDRADPEWRRGGERALIDENGKVNTVNFWDWTRNNMFRVHNFNPTSPVNFFSDKGMGIDTNYRTIDFYEIVFTRSFFLDKDEKGNAVINKDYEALRNGILMEAFLFQLMRNGDITYFQNRGVKNQMLEQLTAALSVNPLTRGNFFETIFTQPSMYKKSIRDLEVEQRGGERDETGEKRVRGKLEGNFYMGDAVREALAAYINIFDYGQLVKILGEDAPLFKREIENWDSEHAVRSTDKPFKEIKHDVKEERLDFRGEKRSDKWFNADGTVKLGAINPKTRKWEPSPDGKTGIPAPDFMRYINPFLAASPEELQVSEARERIVLSIMQRNGISYREAQIAEAWAYSMTHIHGVAARNDTDSVAYDWWTRLTNFMDYRKRQKAERRGAPYGGKHNLEGFKRIGLTFFEAARDRRNRSIQTIIQGGSGKDIDIKGNPLKKTVDYEKENGVIKFFDEEGKEVSGLAATSYEFYEDVRKEGEREIKETKVRFKDATGKIVDVGSAKPKVEIKDVDVPVEFKRDIQKYFIPNHMMASAGVYEFIMSQVGLNLPELVTGYHLGHPILDIQKINEIKAKIEHDIRYSLSTWPEINYGDEQVMWERKEVRDSRGWLIAREKGKNGEDLYLDEDYFILDRFGRRTKVRNEPETYLESRQMTMLESMFGVDALKFIQSEIEKRGLGEGKDVRTIRGTGKDGKEKEVKVDFSKWHDDEFRIAVWRGAFDYLIASEIESHRDRSSGLRWYDAIDMKKASDALIGGELLTGDEVGKVRAESKTSPRRVWSQSLSFKFSEASSEWSWELFKLMLVAILTGKEPNPFALK